MQLRESIYTSFADECATNEHCSMNADRTQCNTEGVDREGNNLCEEGPCAKCVDPDATGRHTIVTQCYFVEMLPMTEPYSRVNCASNTFHPEETLVLAGGAILPAPAVPSSTRISGLNVFKNTVHP